MRILRPIAFFLSFISLFSCSEDHVRFVIEDSQSLYDSINSIRTKLTFLPHIESSNFITRAVTPIAVDRYAHYYVYKEGESPLIDSYYTMGIYKSLSIGTMTSVYEPVNVPAGTYDFYGAGSNYDNVDQGPSFTDGIATGLSQSVDYLWWNRNDVSVSGQTYDLPVVFLHMCAQISLVFTATEGVTIDEISFVDINLGDPYDCYFNLKTGVISPSTTLSFGQTNMILNKNVATVTTLPLTSEFPLLSIILATIDGEENWYNVYVPMPSNDSITGGNSYVYSVIFDSNDKSFTSNLKDMKMMEWQHTDDTGKLLYPDVLNK